MIEINCSKQLQMANGPRNFEVDLKLESGDFLALYGDSGSGKTTILRMLAGLTKPDNGFIKVGEETWFDSTKKINKKPQERKVGLVFQDYNLFPHMTVLENITFVTGSQSSELVAEVIEQLGLTALQAQKPDNLSGGQRQRVALARALAFQPKVLLLDEPLSALHSEMRVQLQSVIREIHQKYGQTTLMASHDQSEIIRLASKVSSLVEGRNSAPVQPKEMFKSPQNTIFGEVVAINETTIQLLVNQSIIEIPQEKGKQPKVGDLIELTRY